MAPQRRRIAITGASGLIGGALAEYLQDAGHRVHRLVRRREAATDDDVYWSVRDREIDAERLDGVDAVVHLAGHPIGAERWSPRVKEEIRESRVAGTALLAEALTGLADPPAVLLSGSAVGFYGDRGEELLTETATPGDDFMASVCIGWEQAADAARAAGIRVVHPRTGVVMAPEGPLIEKVELPFKLGVGGRIGDGQQWIPWIALEDEVRALAFLLDGGLAGPVNLTAPNPVRNEELTRAIGGVLHRPTIFPTPMLAIRVLYGEMGVSLATVSQRAVPRRLLDAGFEFRVPDLRDALERALT